MTPNPATVELLQAEVDENDESYFRLLYNGKSIRYLTIAAGLYAIEDMCFGPSLFSILPPFPAGNWNDGLVTKDPKSGQPYFARAVRTAFPGVKHLWHKTYVDYLDVTWGEKLKGGVYEVTSPRSETTMVAKFARFEWEIGYIESETTAFEWIEGQGIGPKFLGHLTEEGRVIGFLMERIANARHAGPDDLSACKDALSRLHRLGIKHGDINKHNFLIRDNKAVLIDFDTSRKCEDQEAFHKEILTLEESSKDASGRGGTLRTTGE